MLTKEQVYTNYFEYTGDIEVSRTSIQILEMDVYSINKLYRSTYRGFIQLANCTVHLIKAL